MLPLWKEIEHVKAHVKTKLTKHCNKVKSINKMSPKENGNITARNFVKVKIKNIRVKMLSDPESDITIGNKKFLKNFRS